MVLGLNDVISEIQSWSGLITSEVDNTLTIFCVSNALPRLLSQEHYILSPTLWVGSIISSMNDYELSDCLNYQR